MSGVRQLDPDQHAVEIEKAAAECSEDDEKHGAHERNPLFGFGYRFELDSTLRTL